MILKPDDPRQFELTCRADIVKEEPLVGLIDRVVNNLDLNELYSRFSEAGRSFYDPSMQLKVLFFAYCDGVRASREIAKHISYDLRYRYFCGCLRPDFRTINRFRKDNLDLLGEYFAQIVLLCEESGLLDLSVLALDGTKLRANSSGRNGTRVGLVKVLRDSLQTDADIEEPDKVADNEDEQELLEVRTTVDRKFSDPDARYMKTSEGGKRLSYNSQIMVDKNQLIVLAEVGNNACDSVYLRGLLNKSKQLFGGRIGAVAADGGYCSGRNLQYAADEGVDLYLPLGKGEGRVPDEAFNRHAFKYDALRDVYICPAGKELRYSGLRNRNGLKSRRYSGSSRICGRCAVRLSCTRARYRRLEISDYYKFEQQMKTKMASRTGRVMSVLRRCLVEPVFGNIKFNLGFNRFRLRTLNKVRGEFYLICIAHNLKKMLNLLGNPLILSAFKDIIKNIIAYLKIMIIYRLDKERFPKLYRIVLSTR